MVHRKILGEGRTKLLEGKKKILEGRDIIIEQRAKIEKRLVHRIIRVSFWKIFLFWISLILFCGIIYFMLNSFTNSQIINKTNVPLPSNLHGFINSVYFSFVTATTIGYGDLMPRGINKIFAVVEAVLGLLVLGLVISKLVSIKQEAVLDQLYEISFEENISKLRSTLYLFRIEAKRIMENVKSKNWTKEETLEHFDINLMSFENALKSIRRLVLEPNKYDFLLRVDDPGIEIMFESIGRSLHKLYELFTFLDSKRINIKTAHLIGHIESILSISKDICEKCSYKIENKTFLDTIEEINKETDKLKV